MTTTVNQTSALIAVLPTMDLLRTGIGLIAILLLVFLLVQKELVRAYGGPRCEAWASALDIAIVPLLFVLAVIFVMRLLNALYGW
jgi:hypothetical protein